jgi:ActR/RegA family two-component response regulator
MWHAIRLRRSASPKSQKGNWMKLRVLVVDDDSQYRELLQHWLEFEGHEAILAENLEDGL